MSGIRELFALMYWVNNDKRSILESSFRPQRPVSKIQQAVEESRKKQRSLNGNTALEARGRNNELNS